MSRKRRLRDFLISGKKGDGSGESTLKVRRPLTSKESEQMKDLADQKVRQFRSLRTRETPSGPGDDNGGSSDDAEEEKCEFSGSSGDEGVTDKGRSRQLKIRKVRTRKDKIKNPPLSEQDILPKLGTSTIMNGTTGQGKSTLLANLMRNPNFLGGEGIFKHRFLCSPTAEGDDVQKQLAIPKGNTFSDLHEAPEMIREVLKFQKEQIKEKGNDQAPQIVMIFDDIISDPLFMKTDEFIKCFIASRHYNATVFVCTQSWTAVPRKCRLQAKNIFFFSSPLSEVECLCLEHCPPGMTKKQFYALVDYATQEPYSFLYINKSVPMDERYRRNIDERINLEFFRQLDTSRKGKLERAHRRTNQTPDGEHSPVAPKPQDSGDDCDGNESEGREEEESTGF